MSTSVSANPSAMTQWNGKVLVCKIRHKDNLNKFLSMKLSKRGKRRCLRCVRCENHGLSVPVNKDHLNDCPYRSCICGECRRFIDEAYKDDDDDDDYDVLQTMDSEDKSDLSMSLTNDSSNSNSSSSFDSPDLVKGKKKKPPRNPKCARCKNHGLIIPVKDHKDDCPKRTCLCKACIHTAVRQRDMKISTRIRRKANKDQRLRMGEFAAPPTPPPTPPLGLNLSVTAPSAAAAAAAAEAADNTLIKKSDVDILSDTDTKHDENILDYSVRMILRLGYPWQTLTLFYVMLKYGRMNPDVVLKLIMEGSTYTPLEVNKRLLGCNSVERLHNEVYYLNLNFQILKYVTVI